jgi:hypothetical protein
MFNVHFFEKRDLLLSQLREQLPSEGEDLKIKGRKAKVSSVTSIDDNNIHVQVILEKVNKNKFLIDPKKKKR